MGVRAGEKMKNPPPADELVFPSCDRRDVAEEGGDAEPTSDRSHLSLLEVHRHAAVEPQRRAFA